MSNEEPKVGVYDHPSTDAAEAANAENTKAWIEASKKAAKDAEKDKK